MAKGSLFWSKARGKLGDVVLSQLKGQQVARAYQPTVANPRTTAQTDQRILFSNAVKFYKHATQNMFKFAYEDKRSNESYYNAFMRKNAKVSMLPTRAQYLNQNYPAIGNAYLMSEGSLPSLPLKFPSDGNEFTLDLGTVEGEQGNMSVGNVSAALVNLYGLSNGDIITIVLIDSSVTEIGEEGDKPPVWNIAQFIIDTESQLDFKTFLGNYGAAKFNLSAMKGTTGKGEIGFGLNPSNAEGGCMIVSRNINGQKLLVSTSYLVNNDTANTIYEASLQDNFRMNALNSWGRKTSAILQGSIATRN